MKRLHPILNIPFNILAKVTGGRRFILFFTIVSLPLLIAFLPPPQENLVHGRAKTQPRPALSGPVSHHDTQHFRIHYTLAGEDAVSTVDQNSDGLPDYVADVAEALEYAWVQEVERLGWRMPLPDEGEGGDERLDVYLEYQDEFYGYVDTLGGYVGDNQMTVGEEDGAAYGYIGLSHDYTSNYADEELPPLDLLRTTVAHELHHAIQAAYDENDIYYWLYEASAVWIEDEIYPEIGDAESYLDDYLNTPDICPLSVGVNEDDIHWYGGWIFLRYLSEHYGGPDTIRYLWEQLAVSEGLTALETALTTRNITPAELFINFSIANLVQADCPAHSPYCYAKGSHYLRPRVEEIIDISQGEADTLTPKDGVQQFGVDYIRLKSDQAVQLVFQGSKAGVWELWTVGLQGNDVTVTQIDLTQPVTLEPATFERFYLAVLNVAPVEQEADCGYHNYALALADAATTGDLEPPPLVADPGPYIPPGSETEPSVNLFPPPNLGQPITAAEVPFDLRYADYLPPGYDFAQILQYDEETVAAWKQDYAPGSAPIIALKYAGPEPDDYIAIAASPTPYVTLDEWVEARGYNENYRRLVSNVPVFLVEYDQPENKPFSSATLIDGERFMVITGAINFIEMQQVVAGLLAAAPIP